MTHDALGRSTMPEKLRQLGLTRSELGSLQEEVQRHRILLGKLANEVGSGNVLYGIEDPSTSDDIATHAAIAAAHHAKYTDAEAITAVEGHGDAYNGSFLEPLTFVVTSNGSTITGTIDKNPSGDLTERFSDGFSTLSSGGTVSLTAGSATAPKKNYIYVLQSNKGVLVASDSDWPAAEHIKVAEVVVQTAALVQSDGILANRNWNDFTQGTDGQGHHLHAWERLRWEHSAYKSGSAVTWSGSGTGALDLAITAGKAYQMHLQSTAAFDTTDPDKVYVVNHPTAYTATADIETLVVDSDNDSLSNKYYNLVIWRSVSSGSEEEKVLINLPSGSYTKQGDATSDVSGYDNYSIPSGFRGYGYLVQRVTIKHSTGGGGTWTIIQETDLRGSVPTVAVGSGTASITTEFADNQFKLFDEGDPTKELAFQVSGISASTVRTITVPDKDLTLIDTADAIAAVEGEATLDLTGDATIAAGKSLAVDTIGEKTGAAGVLVDTVQIKDNGIILIEAADHPIAPAATKGQIWVKTATPNELWFTDDAGTDVQLGVAAGGEHNILDGSTHRRTVAQTASRGSLILANSSSLWDELVVGAANSVLTADGTDVAWDDTPTVEKLTLAANDGGSESLLVIAPTTAASTLWRGIDMNAQITMSGNSRVGTGLYGTPVFFPPSGGSGYQFFGLDFATAARINDAITATATSVIAARAIAAGVTVNASADLTISALTAFDATLNMQPASGALDVTVARGLHIHPFTILGSPTCGKYQGILVEDHGGITPTTDMFMQLGGVVASDATAHFRVMGDSFTSAANETPVYISEGATPTVRQLKTKDGAAIGGGDLVCVLV